MSRDEPRAQVQVVKRGVETWELTRVEMDSAGKNVHEYTLLGRIIRDGDWYYVELPHWQDIGYAWHRVERGWVTRKAALRALVDREKRAS
jgi:hypothetical protein